MVTLFRHKVVMLDLVQHLAKGEGLDPDPETSSG
jgi:hypothetical protein